MKRYKTKAPSTLQKWEFTLAQKRRVLRQHCEDWQIDPPCVLTWIEKTSVLNVETTLGVNWQQFVKGKR